MELAERGDRAGAERMDWPRGGRQRRSDRIDPGVVVGGGEVVRAVQVEVGGVERAAAAPLSLKDLPEVAACL